MKSLDHRVQLVITCRTSVLGCDHLYHTFLIFLRQCFVELRSLYTLNIPVDLLKIPLYLVRNFFLQKLLHQCSPIFFAFYLCFCLSQSLLDHGGYIHQHTVLLRLCLSGRSSEFIFLFQLGTLRRILRHLVSQSVETFLFLEIDQGLIDKANSVVVLPPQFAKVGLLLCQVVYSVDN